MPRIRRHRFPPPLFQHLLDRIQQRKIPASQLEPLARWLDTEPEVPEGQWCKRFSGMTVCGEGELIKTFLLPGQRPKGERITLSPVRGNVALRKKHGVWVYRAGESLAEALVQETLRQVRRERDEENLGK